jgi:hypothetical protein
MAGSPAAAAGVGGDRDPLGRHTRAPGSGGPPAASESSGPQDLSTLLPLGDSTYQSAPNAWAFWP